MMLSPYYYCLLVLLAYGQCNTISILKTSPWQHHIVSGDHPDGFLVLSFNNTINETGWSHLEIHGRPDKASDEEMAYMAGYAEGAYTGDLIYMMYMNTLGGFCESSSNFCDKLNNFLTQNLNFMREKIQQNPDSAYWHQVSLYLTQLDGLQKGYNSNGNLPRLPQFALQYLQYSEDIGDLQEVFSADLSERMPLSHRHITGSGHCSALIKVLPNNSDLYTSHDTWGDYHGMLRVYKLYDLPYNKSLLSGQTVPGSRISHSSYPGKLQSQDDYYIMNTGLVAMETTNENFNSALWKDVSYQCVLEPIRAMVANRLATTGEEWCQLFAMYNSGTYNNQYMIVDYKEFIPNQPLPDANLLWVLEQMPGRMMYGDQTQVLKNKTYWASYNIPFYSDIFDISGCPDMVRQYGSFFSHDNCPRGQIFARDHSRVTDMDSLIALMRYNDYQHDPLSKCNCNPPYSAENAISARSDLNPRNGTYPISAEGHRCHGGTDNKVTSSKMVKELSCLATCGPTYSQQPVFQWSTSGFGSTPPLGHPDKFEFTPVLIKWGT